MYKFSHVGIVVQDMDQAVDFYTRILGCEVHSQHQDDTIQFALLRAGGQEIELLRFPNDNKERKEGVISHIAFSVADITNEINRLKGFGVKLTSDQPREVMGGMKIFFFTGPNGESIEFVQKPNK